MTFIVALWSSFIRFLVNLFSRPPTTPLPVPVTAKVASSRPDSPRTPSHTSTPSDRSPTTLSDGSLEVISLGDRLADIGTLPSPWSPIGKGSSQDVWMSVDGILTNATGPLNDDDDDDDSDRTAMLSLSRMSTVSLYSSSSALGAFGISVFANLDEAETPPKRRETLTSKRLSTPLTNRDNADISHIHTASSKSSLAYELRMGLFADGRSMSTFDNIIPLLDQASPESI